MAVEIVFLCCLQADIYIYIRLSYSSGVESAILNFYFRSGRTVFLMG